MKTVMFCTALSIVVGFTGLVLSRNLWQYPKGLYRLWLPDRLQLLNLMRETSACTPLLWKNVQPKAAHGSLAGRKPPGRITLIVPEPPHKGRAPEEPPAQQGERAIIKLGTMKLGMTPTLPALVRARALLKAEVKVKAAMLPRKERVIPGKAGMAGKEVRKVPGARAQGRRASS